MASAGTLRRRRPAGAAAPADARQRPDPRPDVAARQQRCRSTARAAAATMSYLPTLGLWERPSRRRRASPRWRRRPVISPTPTCIGDGVIVASRLQMQFDLWRYPTDGGPRRQRDGAPSASHARRDRCRRRRRAPSDRRDRVPVGQRRSCEPLGADDRRPASCVRSPTSVSPSVAMGVPIWSPDGKSIAFVSSRGNTGLGFGVWLVNPDGGNLRNLAARGLGFAWSPDARWVYYADAGVLYKVPATGGGARRRETGSGAQRGRFRRRHDVFHGRPDAHRRQSGL